MNIEDIFLGNSLNIISDLVQKTNQSVFIHYDNNKVAFCNCGNNFIVNNNKTCICGNDILNFNEFNILAKYFDFSNKDNEYTILINNVIFNYDKESKIDVIIESLNLLSIKDQRFYINDKAFNFFINNMFNNLYYNIFYEKEDRKSAKKNIILFIEEILDNNKHYKILNNDNIIYLKILYDNIYYIINHHNILTNNIYKHAFRYNLVNDRSITQYVKYIWDNYINIYYFYEQYNVVFKANIDPFESILKSNILHNAQDLDLLKNLFFIAYSDSEYHHLEVLYTNYDEKGIKEILNIYKYIHNTNNIEDIRFYCNIEDLLDVLSEIYSNFFINFYEELEIFAKLFKSFDYDFLNIPQRSKTSILYNRLCQYVKNNKIYFLNVNEIIKMVLLSLNDLNLNVYMLIENTNIINYLYIISMIKKLLEEKVDLEIILLLADIIYLDLDLKKKRDLFELAVDYFNIQFIF